MMGRGGEPLALAHREALTPLLAAHPHGPPEQALSDATFANLYLFRAAHRWRWVADPRAPRITGLAYDGTPLVLPLFDLASLAPDAAATLLDVPGAMFGPLSNAQISRLDTAAWALSSVRDEADYLYPAEQFRHYRGRLLQKKRNLTKQLLAQLQGLGQTVQAEPYRPALAPQAATVLDAWLIAKSKHPGDADDAPCREALALSDVLGLEGTLYRIGSEPVGVVLAETLSPGVMVMRFAKAVDRHTGVYQHMFQQFCQARPALNWLNFEQDLGQANFRQTKLSYQPTALLAKVRARPRLVGGPASQPPAASQLPQDPA